MEEGKELTKKECNLLYTIFDSMLARKVCMWSANRNMTFLKEESKKYSDERERLTTATYKKGESGENIQFVYKLGFDKTGEKVIDPIKTEEGEIEVIESTSERGKELLQSSLYIWSYVDPLLYEGLLEDVEKLGNLPVEKEVKKYLISESEVKKFLPTSSSELDLKVHNIQFFEPYELLVLTEKDYITYEEEKVEENTNN